ncbi:cysteine hydrolase family protein [Mediterraneibacter sp. ICN-202921]|uniref:cysteine hydrolase family protein n=1 Tax=Mediterraneibacter sp. ICN-202921 TaxID=3134657 RepID=UPI000E541D0D|nr:cysteine hydrolase [Ruminococcus sp. AF18-22]
MQVLIVVDMQNDFIDGSLGTKEAHALTGRLAEKIKEFDGMVLATRDTHGEDYLSTLEGKKLPVVHCIAGTRGWQLHSLIARALEEQAEKMSEKDWGKTNRRIFDKPTFASRELAQYLLWLKENKTEIESITLAGLCTDICVISNALFIKALLPETEIKVDASLCAGVTVHSHKTALEAMKACQINIINEEKEIG